MRKSMPLAIVGLFLCFVGIGGIILSLFMAQNAVNYLYLSPYVAMALFIVVLLSGWGLFVVFIQKDKLEEECAKLDMISSLNHYVRIYEREHRYIPSRATIDDIIEGTLKAQDKKGVTINGEQRKRTLVEVDKKATK